VDGLGNFIKLWRSNFVEAMNPQHLPYGWRIEHTVGRTFGTNSIFNKETSNEGEDASQQEDCKSE
jgi:hypothetical protein